MPGALPCGMRAGPPGDVVALVGKAAQHQGYAGQRGQAVNGGVCAVKRPAGYWLAGRFSLEIAEIA